MQEVFTYNDKSDKQNFPSYLRSLITAGYHIDVNTVLYNEPGLIVVVVAHKEEQ